MKQVKIREVHLIDEEGNCVQVLNPIEFFYDVKFGKRQRISAWVSGLFSKYFGKENYA